MKTSGQVKSEECIRQRPYSKAHKFVHDKHDDKVMAKIVVRTCKNCEHLKMSGIFIVFIGTLHWFVKTVFHLKNNPKPWLMLKYPVTAIVSKFLYNQNKGFILRPFGTKQICSDGNLFSVVEDLACDWL